MIDSLRNPHVRLFRSLRQRKFRLREGVFALEGPHLLAEALATDWPLREVLFCRELFGGEEQALLDAVEGLGVPCRETSARVFHSLSHTESPQGLAAVARLPETRLDALTLGDAAFVLLACEIQDPGNLGTMLRAAAAAGVDAVLTTHDSADAFSPKVVRSSAGTVLRVPIVQDLSSQELTRWATAQDLTLIVATTKAQAVHFQVTYPPRAALVVGNEARGVSADLVAAADLCVRIPMPGEVESLNAAMAAAILLFEVVRQRSTM